MLKEKKYTKKYGSNVDEIGEQMVEQFFLILTASNDINRNLAFFQTSRLK